MKLGYIGLGKMGRNMVERLLEKKHEVVVFDESAKAVADVAAAGAKGEASLKDLMNVLPLPRVVWLMIPHGAVDGVLKEIAPYLAAGDTVIDGGNSFYKDSVRRAGELAAAGIYFLDAGVSGGPAGARNGACVMVGGEREVYAKLEPLFKDIAADNAYGYMGQSGAGHFVKMVHNGIEYGMMQAIAEGFALFRAAADSRGHDAEDRGYYNFDLMKIAELYNHQSVIESRLVGWLADGFEKHGAELNDVSGTAAQSGEGMWTAETARALGVPAPIIEGAVAFRKESEKHPSYAGKILSVMRNIFGGHDIK
jgi:6-phosphogluconate dehydrogenase